MTPHSVPQLVTPLPFAQIGLNQFVEYQRPVRVTISLLYETQDAYNLLWQGRIVTDVSHMELSLSNSTWSGALTPVPTFSPGNGPQYIAQGNVSIDPAVVAEGAYSEFPFRGGSAGSYDVQNSVLTTRRAAEQISPQARSTRSRDSSQPSSSP